MRVQWKAAMLAALTVTTLPTAAYGQAVPDIEGAIVQGGQIDDVIDEQDRLNTQLQVDDGEIDGEAGIYILKKNDIFFVGGAIGTGYSENPQRILNNVEDSFWASAAFTAGVQTKIAEAVDFGVRANVSGLEYFSDFGPSSRNTSASITVGTPIAGTPLYASASAFGGFNFDGDFENGVAFYGGSLSVNAALPVGQRTLIRPSIGVSRQWSEIEENNATSAAANLTVLHIVAPKVVVSADAFVNRTWFDNFFEDVIFVERRDWNYGGGASLSYRPNEWLNTSVSVGYEKRDSSFFISEYDGFDASLLVSATLEF